METFERSFFIKTKTLENLGLGFPSKTIFRNLIQAKVSFSNKTPESRFPKENQNNQKRETLCRENKTS